MENLSIFLAANGVVVLLFSSLAGLVLAKALHHSNSSEHWHLLHASGTSRGIMLIALASIVPVVALPSWQLSWATGLVTLFVWTSVCAMTLRALTGEKGFHAGGSSANKVVFLLYTCGTLALPMGLVWILLGLMSAAQQNQ